MWGSTLFGSSNAEEDENLLCDEILIKLENHISEAEARSAKPVTQWDGYCGLVRISDDELVRPKAPNSNQIPLLDAHQRRLEKASLLENTTSQEQQHHHHSTTPSAYSNNKPKSIATSTTIPTCEEIIEKATSLPSKSQARQLLSSVLVDSRRCTTVTPHQATLLIDTILKLEGIEGVNIESIIEVQRALEWYQAGEVRRCLQQLHAATSRSDDDGVHRELTTCEIQGVKMLKQWIMAHQTHV